MALGGYGDSWILLTALGGSLLLLGAIGDSWKLLTDLDGSWRLFPALRSPALGSFN